MAPNVKDEGTFKDEEDTKPIILKKVQDVHQALGMETKDFVYDQDLKWVHIVGLTLIHVTGIYGYIFGLPHIKFSTFVFYFVYGLMSAIGITVGVHRFYSHRSFKANLPLRIILMVFYASAGQLKLVTWARDHRLHHKFSETIYDPYNAKRGLFFAHIGWLMRHRHPLCVEKGKSIDMSDMENDPVVRFHDNNFFLMKSIFCFILPTMIGHYVFGETLFLSFMLNMSRYMTTLNNTWFVNSLAHNYTMGKHPYNKFIGPTDNTLAAALSFGEGWHNFHHTFPWDYRSAEFGMDLINMPMSFINFFAKLGWAYDLKAASPELIMRQALRKGDGSRFVGGRPIAEAKLQ